MENSELQLLNTDGMIDAHTIQSELNTILNKHFEGTEDQTVKAYRLSLDVSKLIGRIEGELQSLHTLKRNSLNSGKKKK